MTASHPHPTDHVEPRRVQAARLALIGGTGGGALLTMLWMAWAGRQLGPAAASDFYGAVFLIFAIYMLGHPINGLAARFGALWQAQQESARIWPLYVRLMRTLLWPGALLILVALPTLAWQAELLHFREPWALGFALVAGLLALAISAGRGVLRGIGHLTPFAGSVLTEALVRLMVGVAILSVIPSATSAMSAYVIAGVITLGLGEVLVRRALGRPRPLARSTSPELSEPPPSPLDSRALLAFAGPMLLMAFCDAAFQNLDVLVAKRVFTPTVAGQYGAVATLTRALGVIVQPFALLVIPLLTARHARAQPLGRSLAGLTFAFLALAAIPMLAFTLWPEQLLVLIYGDRFAAAAPWLIGHALASLASFLSLMIAQAFAAVARFRFLIGYAGGTVALALGLWLWHGTPAQVIDVTLAVKAGVLLLVCGWWGVTQGRD